MKKIAVPVLLGGIILSTSFAFAESRNDDVNVPYAPSISHVSASSEMQEKISSKSISWIKWRGDRLIKERISSLNENAKAIAGSKLTTEQKSALDAIIVTNVAGLTALNASIASSTDATSTKALVNSIFTNFRIYAIVIPQIRLEKRTYDLLNHSVTLQQDVFVKTQQKIDEYKGKGKDVTAWQKSLDDAKVLVTTDVATLQSVMTKVSALKPSDYGTTSKSVIESANADLKKVAKDFNTLRSTIKKPSYMKNSTATTTPVTLSGTSWKLVSFTQGTTQITPRLPEKFVITFSTNGQMGSTTDCNGVGASYTAGTSTLTFGALMSTMMFCEGSQESAYVQSLGSVSSYKIDGRMLTLTTASGTMTFSKKN